MGFRVRSLVSHLVATCLALHTLLGCCVHHAHAKHADLGTICGRCDRHERAAYSPDRHSHDDRTDDDHGCSDSHAEASDVEAGNPCDGRPCDGGHDGDEEHGIASHDGRDGDEPCSGSCGDKCQFVSTARMQLENPVVDVDVVITRDLLADSAAVAASNHATKRDTAPPPLPLRLHLWNGLLLI